MKKNNIIIIRDKTTNELKFYLEPIISSQQDFRGKKMAIALVGEKNTNEKKDENKNNIDIYLLGRYMQFVIEATRKYLKENCCEYERFSLTTAKFQKLLIFAFCRFIKKNPTNYRLSDNQGEELSLSNVSCGFSINYDFSVFLLPSFDENNLADINCSLNEVGINFKAYNHFVLNEINSLYGIDSFMVSIMPSSLKNEINLTVFTYILFKAKELGNILNNCKDSNIQSEEKITFKDLAEKLDYVL